MLRDFLRGAVQVHVLHHAAESGVHGAWMAGELARHGYQISPGTLYPLLHRMEAAGLLASRQRVADGRVRRVYEATAAGRTELARLRSAVRELAAEVLPEGHDLAAGAPGGETVSAAPGHPGQRGRAR